MAKIYDNIEIKFEEGLRGIVTNNGVKRVDFCVGYFNLRGWDLIVDQVDRLCGDNVWERDNQKFRYCRLLIGMQLSNNESVRSLYCGHPNLMDANEVQRHKLQIVQDFKKQLITGLPTNKDEQTLKKLSEQLKNGKVCVKLYLKEQLHAKLYLAYRPGDSFCPIQAILGSSNLTYSGLTKQGELNAEFPDRDNAEKLANWFDDRWNERFCLDISKELSEIIDKSWASDTPVPPYYIYLKTAYHLSEEARQGIKEFKLSNEFRRELFDFQQTAVKIAAKNLYNEKRNGAMIGDVVGLGKTITACAIIKLYEMAFASSTLILCPANLQEMWKKYIRKYDLKADVHSIAKPIDVENSRFYRLVIVDESHNLRNSNGVRYKNIRKLIDYQDSKVLLLTATPYNKNFYDLSSQLRLFIDENQDLGIRPEEYIRFLGGEREFQRKHSEIFIRSIRAFEESHFADDWNDLMKLFLIRRTRTFIKDNYAKVDPDNQRKYLQFPNGEKSYFPTRIPKAIKFDTHPEDQYSRLYSDDMITLMECLRLPRYGLYQYFDPNKAIDETDQEKRVIDNLSKAGSHMSGFCKSTFFKRIDSSGVAFLLTVYRHILRNAVFLFAIDNKLPLPVGDDTQLDFDYLDQDEIEVELETLSKTNPIDIKKKEIHFPNEMNFYIKKAKDCYATIRQRNVCTWIPSIYFKRTLKQHLKSDCEKLLRMINLCGDWEPNQDAKLLALHKLISRKHKKDKIVIFTQFSDTAHYIYEQLKNMKIQKIACVTGSSKDPTKVVEHFSPESNGQKINEDDQVRILIATDVLSEGQNLQDCHIIVNYDLPWAIIRLIQRAGRVDRIGQKAKEIHCYSFFPAEGVENIIRLKERLNQRINENAHIVGSDEIFFEGNEQNLRDMFNEKSGILDDEDDNDVDLASQAYQIWKNAIDANPRLEKIIPALSNVIYSTKPATGEQENSVISYAKTYSDFDVLTWTDTNGNIISQSQRKILNALHCSPDTECQEPLDNHHEIVAQSVQNISTDRMSLAGILGSRSSTRHRLINLLEDFKKNPPSLFFQGDDVLLLDNAIDEIYQNPLQETAKLTLNRMLRNKAKDLEIVDTILELRKNGSLCIVEDRDLDNKDPSIICSMGIKKI